MAVATSSCFSPSLPVFPPTLFLGLEAEDKSIRSSVPCVEISELCCRRHVKMGGGRDLIYCEEHGRFATAQRVQKDVRGAHPSERVHVCAGACTRPCARVCGHTPVHVLGRIGKRAVVSYQGQQVTGLRPRGDQTEDGSVPSDCGGRCLLGRGDGTQSSSRVTCVQIGPGQVWFWGNYS